MLDSNRFMVYGSTGHHDLDADVLDIVNDTTGLNLKFSHTWFDDWGDAEPAFVIEGYKKIQDKHVIVFGCPITDHYELQLRDMVTAVKHQYRAKSVTVVMSYLRYRRQDRKSKHHEITRLRWFMMNLKCWGADRLIICEPHNERNTAMFCNEFGIELSMCDPTPLFVEKIRLKEKTFAGGALMIYSPDLGSFERSLRLATALGCGLVATPKKRTNEAVEMVDPGAFLDELRQRYPHMTAPLSCNIGDVHGMHVIMREDEVATGSTAAQTAVVLRKYAASVHLAVTHGVCNPGWKNRLLPHPEDEMEPFDDIWMGNTRPRGVDKQKYENSTGGRIKPVNVASVIAGSLISVLQSIRET